MLTIRAVSIIAVLALKHHGVAIAAQMLLAFMLGLLAVLSIFK